MSTFSLLLKNSCPLLVQNCTVTIIGCAKFWIAANPMLICVVSYSIESFMRIFQTEARSASSCLADWYTLSQCYHAHVYDSFVAILIIYHMCTSIDL